MDNLSINWWNWSPTIFTKLELNSKDSIGIHILQMTNHTTLRINALSNPKIQKNHLQIITWQIEHTKYLTPPRLQHGICTDIYKCKFSRWRRVGCRIFFIHVRHPILNFLIYQFINQWRSWSERNIIIMLPNFSVTPKNQQILK